MNKIFNIINRCIISNIVRHIFEKNELDKVFELLQNADGIIVQDDLEEFIYPMPINAEGTDKVYVGRIRRDYSIDNGLNLWVVADNTRKGAATNAVQIAELLIKNLR